ncbi:hypothetical protein Tco_0287137 [Tanacetum coccineum]
MHTNFSPHKEHAQGQMTVDDLLQLVPQLMTKIDSLEKDLKQTKLTMGSAIVKLVKKVKKLEGVLKRRNVVLLDFEEGEPEAQGRKREEQVEDINPTTLEAAKTLSRVASQKPKSIDKGRRRDALSCRMLSDWNSLEKEEEAKQHYTDEDWDLIRAKIEANAELSKSVLGSGLQGEDFAKKMVELVNQRKKHFAEERARAKRNKPMTQSQLRTYMMNYLKNQGTWKLSQLKNLSFEEVKEEFDKKDVEPHQKTGKRRKQIARKGLHTDLDKDDSEDSDEASEQDDSASGTKIPINPVPVAMKSPSIATYKIIKQGKKSVYQIVREDGTDIVYINFGAMLKDITRDESYRIILDCREYMMNVDDLLKLVPQLVTRIDSLETDLKQTKLTMGSDIVKLVRDEDWDLIRAKIEANAELSKSVLGSDLQGEDFAKKMVKLVNQRKKHFAEERARAKRNKPMTQSQLRTYMMNYLKNQGTWKLSQLKNLSFEKSLPKAVCSWTSKSLCLLDMVN